MFDLEDCLAYLASRSAKQLASALEKRLAPHGISRARWMVLYYTEKYDHLTQARLAGKKRAGPQSGDPAGCRSF